MTIDDFIDYLDGDPEMNETVDNAIKRICSREVVLLDSYRKLVTQYRGWKPLPLKDYAEKLNGTRFTAMKLELAQQRKEDNEKVKRSHRLKPTPKK